MSVRSELIQERQRELFGDLCMRMGLYPSQTDLSDEQRRLLYATWKKHHLSKLIDAVTKNDFAPVQWTPELAGFLERVMQDYARIFQLERLSQQQYGEDCIDHGTEKAEAYRDYRNVTLRAIKSRIAQHALTFLRSDVHGFNDNQAVKVISQTIIATVNTYKDALQDVRFIDPIVEKGDTPADIIRKVEEFARQCELDFRQDAELLSGELRQRQLALMERVLPVLESMSADIYPSDHEIGNWSAGGILVAQRVKAKALELGVEEKRWDERLAPLTKRMTEDFMLMFRWEDAMEARIAQDKASVKTQLDAQGITYPDEKAVKDGYLSVPQGAALYEPYRLRHRVYAACIEGVKAQIGDYYAHAFQDAGLQAHGKDIPPLDKDTAGRVFGHCIGHVLGMGKQLTSKERSVSPQVGKTEDPVSILQQVGHYARIAEIDAKLATGYRPY